jgi:3-dehydroquinate synthase
VLVVTQPGAAPIAARVAAALGADGWAVEVFQVPDGEAAKTLEVAAVLYRRGNALGLTRGDTIVAVGGGAVTDLAGFVAATYLRGIEAVYVPTTLLGAVDAAIGGKSGVNVEGKNLVGVFRHPRRVVVDTDLLAALPAALWQEGLAEVVKAGYVGDPGLIDLLQRTGLAAPRDEVVERAIAVKAAVVEDDFREAGRRMVLNYGHTIGHAVEVACGLSHGAAVAVGMVAAASASEIELGYADAARQRALIASLGLPVTVAGAGDPRVRELMALDKKRDERGLRMVLLAAAGRPEVRHVAAETVDAALAAIAP